MIDLIDEKIESDMDKVLNKMDMISNEYRIRNQSLKNELKNQIKVVYLVIGITIAILTIAITLVKVL